MQVLTCKKLKCPFFCAQRENDGCLKQKKIVSLLLALAMCFSFSVTALADYSGVSGSDVQTEEAEKPEPTRPEETEWYYRITDDGLFQKRLWSITYRKWLTDWITIGHV